MVAVVVVFLFLGLKHEKNWERTEWDKKKKKEKRAVSDVAETRERKLRRVKRRRRRVFLSDM